MRFLEHVLLALLAFTCATLAAPTTKETLNISIQKKRDAFLLPDSNVIDFTKVAQHMNQLKAKYADSLDGYKANTGNVHPLQILGIPLAKRATGSVSLTDVQESLWHGAITLGSTTTQCDFDTGSADIIINPNGYTPGSSSTNTGRTFTASYGDGTTASGKVYTDTITIGGLKASGVSIGRSNSNFIDSSSEGDNGICGMSYPSLSVLGSGSTPFFDGLVKAKAVTSSVFTFTLSSGTSRLYLGGVDPNAGTPTYVSVDSSQGFWTTSSTINGASTSSIVDTGTSLIVAPTSFAQSFFNSLGVSTFTQDGTLYGTYNCNSPPKVTYKFGGFSVALSSSTVTFGTTNDGQCVLSLVGEDTGLNAVIAGDSYLQNVHAVFDRANNRLGFSKQ